MHQTNLGWWALNRNSQAGVSSILEVELGEKDEAGDYAATFLVPAGDEWDAAKLFMHLLSQGPVQADRDAGITRITAKYPGYLGDPNAKHTI
ncbi:hypothetical protein [Streptomyces sp. NPDC005281]|uniref:hypothetical protein n=1 Tax=Streptomyces sp. NPDC005281 TaxID=3155712 RepID=UPI0033A04395